MAIPSRAIRATNQAITGRPNWCGDGAERFGRGGGGTYGGAETVGEDPRIAAVGAGAGPDTGAGTNGEAPAASKGERRPDRCTFCSERTAYSQSTTATASAAIQATIISSIGPKKASRTSTAPPTTRLRLPSSPARRQMPSG